MKREALKRFRNEPMKETEPIGKRMLLPRVLEIEGKKGSAMI